MLNFLRQATSSTPTAGTPKAVTQKARTPATPNTSDVVITGASQNKFSLDAHGGRNGVATKSGELAKVLQLYRDKDAGLTGKRSQTSGQKHVLSIMSKVCVQLGDWANIADRGNEGNLEHLLSKTIGELKGMQTLASENGKACLASMDGGKKLRRLTTLVQECSGYAGAHQLTSAAEGHIGKLNESVRYMGMWMTEESAYRLKYEDVIIDRLDFAAFNINRLRQLRDKWVAFGSELIAFSRQCKTALESSKDRTSTGAGPPAKRQAVERGEKLYVVTRDWDGSSKAPAHAVKAGQKFLTISKGNVVVLESDKMSDEGWALVKRQSDGVSGWVPFARIEERLEKEVSFGKPNLSDDDDEDGYMERKEPPDLEMVQESVDAALEDEESFTLEEFMEDFGGYGYSEEQVEAVLNELVKNGPRGSSGVAIVFDSGRGVYAKAFAESPLTALRKRDSMSSVSSYSAMSGRNMPNQLLCLIKSDAFRACRAISRELSLY